MRPPGGEIDEIERLRSYYARRSARKWAGGDYLANERRELLHKAATDLELDLPSIRVLDVGCGGGFDLAFWRDLGVPEESLFGTELLPARAEAARRALPNATILKVDGFEVPLPDHTFSLTTASLVFSSILDDRARRQLLADMFRVTAPGGLVAIYDFRVRRPGNRNVAAFDHAALRRLKVRRPAARWSAAPLLPALPVVARMPTFLRELVLKVLPRTHVLYLWHR